MIGFRRHLLFLLFFGLAAALVGARARVLATPAEDGANAAVTLTGMLAAPEQYRGQTLTFQCRFAAFGRLFRTNDSVFNQREFENFAVWGDEARLWEKAARGNLIPGLYINREDEALLQILRTAKRYDLLQVTGEVVDSYARLPWVRVTAVRIIPGQGYTETMLVTLAEGEELLRAGKKTAAEEKFRAAAKGAPETITSYAARRIAACLAAEQVQAALPGRDTRKLLKAGQAAFTRGDWAAALALYKDAGASDGALLKEAGYWREFGEIYLSAASGDAASIAAAKKCLEEANRIAGGKDALALSGLARVALAGRDWAGAEALVSESLRLEPDNSPARKLLLQIMSERLAHERQVGKNNMPVAVTRAGAVKAGMLEQARALYIGGQLAQAETLLRSALKNPADPAARETVALLASVLLAQGRAAEAGALLSRRSQNPGVKAAAMDGSGVVAETAPVLPSELLTTPNTEELRRGLQGGAMGQAERDIAATAQALNRLKNDLDQPGTVASTVEPKKPTGNAVMLSAPVKKIRKDVALPDIPQAKPGQNKNNQLPDWAL